MSGHPHLHPPKQSRSRRTLERIVGASLELLDEEGPDGLTVQAIVQRAGSSVGSFYARFDGKDDLLDYLGERLWSEATARWDEVVASRNWDEESLTELSTAAVTLLDDTARRRGATLRALRRAGGGGDAVAAFRDHVLDGLGRILMSRRDEITHPEPQTAVRLGLTAVAGLLEMADGAALREVPRSRIREEAGRLLRSYLRPGEDVAEGGAGVDFFDIWS